MKKLIALILVLLCVLGFTACNAMQKPTRYLDDTSKFAEYLDDINFTDGLTQGDFRLWLEKYSYNDSVITDVAKSFHYDGLSGGGLQGYASDLFGFRNDYTVTEDKEYVNYSNRFYTEVQLDGFEMPFGISFDDKIETVFEKLEMYFDLQKGFISDKDNTGTMTLYSDDHSTLQLINCKMLPATSGAPLYDWEIKYTQTYQTSLSDGRTVDVTRQMIMSFTDDGKLGLLDLSVKEVYKYK
jgi:hypothetical protein